MRAVLIRLITSYQKFLSPYGGKHCLFVPSCSEYTKEAILKYGCLLGIIKGIKRLFQCQGYFFLK